MATAQTHPRRRPQKVDGSQMAPPSLTTWNLRKAGTFHSPTNVSSELVDPVAPYCSMPKRSETNPQSLEQILIDAGERRVAGLLATVDNVLAGKTSSASDASILKDNKVLPVPSFMLDNHTVTDSDPMEIDSKPVVVDHHHASDSGLGSSVSGSIYEAGSARLRGSARSSVTAARSAITKSYSGLSSNSEDNVRRMSEQAIKQIQKRIIKPILQEPSLKDFHSMVKDVPRRIGHKEIKNLRDLEKTLIYLAPECAALSPTKYLRFCETTVTFIASTVNYLCEADQRLPTDRPYTNNYFLDLVEQIRRYAAIMAATRAKRARGEPLSEMDHSPNEKVVLRGGLSRNGRPAELVREKNGRVIPIATDSERASASKRPLEDDESDEDSVHRSMARRRKSDRPGDVMHICPDCKKEFKRPCDLTKHEKTHSRPWKCSEPKCKYHEMGWPTEKERDRHVNDKHSAMPAQYKCLFAPCSYASKRESNCKQHMEKAHGWTYVRSKANGKGPKKSPNAPASLTPQTPLTPFIATPASGMQQLSTPVTPFDNSPSVQSYQEVDWDNYYNPQLNVDTSYLDAFRRESITTAGTDLTYSSTHSPAQPNMFEDCITPPDAGFDHTLFGSGFDFNPTVQQPTPALSDDNLFADHFQSLPQLSANLNVNGFGNTTHLSPGAQPDLTLFSPSENDMQIDEGFGDYPAGVDFPLFDSTSSNLTSNANNGEGNSSNWFPDLSNFGGQFEDMSFPPADFCTNTSYEFNQ
ncbi:uncharacterized protein K452DRAFT_68029 [Aplosporella prunicola CBS 121167]|uniref:C2H2-type domain-containing protein n=1 Tax=Aplosporella prunicola CBS 121167 TaxID=1176127 RepID=A0A6A6BR47_9PEZI|nr:uncharacterized protein K452DRAFT_68029 [Aplosporella prunicola CBS 121167]KAF2146592.1 hypothetical protein K452DRAFT_68029 [Aplosporella prunicola CBS 121167]